MLSLVFTLSAGVSAAQEGLEPILPRVNVQADSARLDQVIDGEWVAVGTRKPHAIQHDHTRLYGGKPSYRFELKADDNTLAGYAPGETKGRAELSYCYATAADFAGLSEADYEAAHRMKTVYHHGKGITPQAGVREYRFAVYIPDDLSPDVCTIFAQWHGMPDRTLTQSPEGEVRRMTTAEFLELESRMVFKKEKGYDRLEGVDKKGNPRVAKEPNGWKVEQGGYPPLAFGFQRGQFYIKVNSDRRWMTDKDDRCSANPLTAKILKPVMSEYKASTIAYAMPFGEFPKNRWVEFRVKIDWTEYGGESETIVRPGRLDVAMTVDGKTRRIVDDAEVLIGRNDDAGYYFKFGIYRVGNSTVPVCYNLAGYEEIEIGK